MPNKTNVFAKVTDLLPLRRDVMTGSIQQYPIVTSQHGTTICEIVGPGNSMEEATASADFIVQACNNHEAMLAALKQVESLLPTEQQMAEYPQGVCWTSAAKQIRAAIAQAEAK